MSTVLISAVLGPLDRGPGRPMNVEVQGTVDDVPVVAILSYDDLQSQGSADAQQLWLAQELTARVPPSLALTTNANNTPINVVTVV